MSRVRVPEPFPCSGTLALPYEIMTCPDSHDHDVTCYTGHRCHCDTCRAAWRAYHAAWRARKLVERGGRIPHGTYGGYTNYGCHCDECSAAMTAKRAEQRARRRVARNLPDSKRRATL